MTIIKTKLVKIGHSHGVRIPTVLLKEVGFDEDVELESVDNTIIVRSATSPRAGWEEAFRRMAEHGDDKLLDPAVPTEWDEMEWEWL